MESKRKSSIRLILALCLTIFFSIYMSANQVLAEQTEVIYYRGVTTSTVNVRQGAGTIYEQVVFNGENVQLSADTEVIITGQEEYKGRAWFNIIFTWKGTELTGWVTSSYVTKTTTQITPTPLPTPTQPPATPTPTPLPTPTSTPTPIPATPTPMPTIDSDGGFQIVWGIIFALAVLAVIAVVAIYLRNKAVFSGKKENSVSQKVNRLKNGRTTEGQTGSNKTVITGKKRPEIRVVSAKDEVENADFDEALFESTEQEETQPPQELTTGGPRESEEKKALREEINSLKQHDLVIHKYFGRGEVYDNSDVKLLEVRFGTDVRFLNKESLIAKRLLRKYEDDRRGPRKKL